MADRGSAVFAIGSLKPLSPEQLAWSVMQATGVVHAQRAAAAVELAKQKQPDAATKDSTPDKQRPSARHLLEKAVCDKLAGNVATFVSVFGQPGDVSARLPSHRAASAVSGQRRHGDRLDRSQRRTTWPIDC